MHADRTGLTFSLPPTQHRPSTSPSDAKSYSTTLCAVTKRCVLSLPSFSPLPSPRSLADFALTSTGPLDLGRAYQDVDRPFSIASPPFLPPLIARLLLATSFPSLARKITPQSSSRSLLYTPPRLSSSSATPPCQSDSNARFTLKSTGSERKAKGEEGSRIFPDLGRAANAIAVQQRGRDQM